MPKKQQKSISELDKQQLAKKTDKVEEKESHNEAKTVKKTSKKHVDHSSKDEQQNHDGSESDKHQPDREHKKTSSKEPIQAPKDTSQDTSQPVINIGLVGHVDHGKTTLTERLTGKWTDTHSEEVKRGITIRLGYADVVFRRCPKCDELDAFTTKKVCENHNVATEFVRKVSFVDAPGHESLMATMLSGATIMDGALLLVAANEQCPQPQTREHLMALQIAGIKNVIIVQNKIDLVTEERALRNYQQIKEFVKGTDFENSPIVPISAQAGVNIDSLISTIEEIIPTPKRNPDADAMLLIARSFDTNKPGTTPDKMVGGILGGAIVQGKLKVGDSIEIRPGLVVEEQNKTVAKPIMAKIISCVTGGKNVQELGPGGSVAIQTTLDPGIVHSDSLTGNIVGHPGKLPKIWYDLKLEVHLLERVVGSQQELKVEPVKMTEPLLLNVNGGKTIGFVYDLSKGLVKCKLKLPICANPGDKAVISRRVDSRFRLIGYALIRE